VELPAWTATTMIVQRDSESSHLALASRHDVSFSTLECVESVFRLRQAEIVGALIDYRFKPKYTPNLCGCNTYFRVGYSRPLQIPGIPSPVSLCNSKMVAPYASILCACNTYFFFGNSRPLQNL